jgi:hypothetical protein
VWGGSQFQRGDRHLVNGVDKKKDEKSFRKVKAGSLPEHVVPDDGLHTVLLRGIARHPRHVLNKQLIPDK